MKFVIEPSVLKKYDISIEEFLVLFINKLDIDIKECYKKLIDRELAYKDMFSDTKLVLSKEMSELLDNMVIESDASVLNRDEEFISLAKELQKEFPKGKKPGTTYPWRGNVAEIVKKLKTLVVKYQCQFTKEQAIEATKKYVESFNGNYTKMRLLKYFLLKNTLDSDNNVIINSDFMTGIENLNSDEETNQDWTVTLKN